MHQPTTDLWIRLERLERCCDVVLESYQVPQDRWRWRMEVHNRAKPGEPPIIVDDDSPIRALARGLDEAETRNWHDRRPSP